MLHGAHENTAARASADMRSNPNVLSFVERAGRERQERDVGGMFLGRHDISPRRARSRATANRRRDFTVPSGIWSSSAISLCGLSSKKDSSITRNCSFDSCAIALRTHCSSWTAATCNSGVETLVNLRFNRIVLVDIELARTFPLLAPEGVNAQITCDREYPG